MKYTGTFRVSSLFSPNCHKSKPSWPDICSIPFKLEGANLFMGKTGRHVESKMEDTHLVELYMVGYLDLVTL